MGLLQEKDISPCALVLAAGLGTRMRPLTDRIPKPLVPLGGKALLDHVLDRLEQAGIERAGVNVHYHADMIEGHLSARRRPQIVISDERAQILDSGGGARKMLPLVGDKPFLLANSDTVWLEQGVQNVSRMIALWDARKMDILLLLASRESSIGFEGKGDFFCDEAGRLTRRAPADEAPYAYAGFALFKPDLFADTPDAPFSLNLLFDRAIAKGTLFGKVLEGRWMHVGTLQALDEAEALLATHKA